MVRRAALGLEDARERPLVEREGAEPVHGLGGERDESPAPQHPGRFGERALVGTVSVDGEDTRHG